MDKKIIALYSLIGLFLFCSFKQSDPFLWGFALDGFPITKEKLENLKNETSYPRQILLFYLSWPHFQERQFSSPLSSLEAIHQHGATPCLTWEPFYFGEGKKNTIPYLAIMGGEYDFYLKFMAEEAKKFGKPLLIRFAHEMNLEEYHWGTTKEAYGKDSGAIYQQMYRYIVDFFKSEKAENVLWVYCPNAESVPNAAWNTLANYYPGSDYADLFGIDGYSWSEESPKSFKEIFQKPFNELKVLDPNKPIIIFETAMAGTQNEKEKWIKEAMQAAEEWKIKAIIWFQVNKEKNWKI